MPATDDMDEHERRSLFFNTPIGARIPMKTEAPKPTDMMRKFLAIALKTKCHKELAFYTQKYNDVFTFLQQRGNAYELWREYANDSERLKLAEARLERALDVVSRENDKLLTEDEEKGYVPEDGEECAYDDMDLSF